MIISSRIVMRDKFWCPTYSSNHKMLHDSLNISSGPKCRNMVMWYDFWHIHKALHQHSPHSKHNQKILKRLLLTYMVMIAKFPW